MPREAHAWLCPARSIPSHYKIDHRLAPLGAGNLEGPSGMIDKREILEATSSFSLGLPSVVEKDYVLGWILAGINAHEELADIPFPNLRCAKEYTRESAHIT
jgi:hypothetical protein